MKKLKNMVIPILLLLTFRILFPILSIATDETVTIKFDDENLYNAMLKEINFLLEDRDDSNYSINIKQSILESINGLQLSSEKITKLDGLEKFVNLQIIGLAENNISDISTLAKMSNIKNLSLYKNNIDDISLLRNMSSIKVLDITHNKITDISPLSSLTELKMLYLGTTGSAAGYSHSGGTTKSSNQITDLKPIENLTNLQILEMIGIGVTDISSLKNLTNLTCLSAGHNNIEDISALSKLYNLKELSLDNNNNIKDCSVLQNLTNLTDISLNECGLTNIDFLNNLKKLEILNISNNNILDISLIGELINLEELSLVHNSYAIDFSILKELKNLKILYVALNTIKNIEQIASIENLGINFSYCNISDFDFMDKSSLTFVDYYFIEYSMIGGRSGGSNNAQKLTMYTNEQEIELPPIFLQAHNPSSKIYTNKEFELSNCILNEKQDKVIVNDGAENAYIKILGGVLKYIELYIVYDTKAPVIAGPSYSTTDQTSGDIVVTIEANEKIQEVEGWTISEDKKTLTKTYTENTTEEVTVKDLAGNEAKTTVTTNNIDKTIVTFEVENYTIKDNKIKNIQPNVTMEEFVKNITSNQDYTIEENGQIITSTDRIKTGQKLTVGKNTYTLVVTGDTNGDGEANIKDILQINKHRLNKIKLTDAYLSAGDVNKDNEINIRDILQVNKYRLGKISTL